MNTPRGWTEEEMGGKSVAFACFQYCGWSWGVGEDEHMLMESGEESDREDGPQTRFWGVISIVYPEQYRIDSAQS